MTDVPYRRQPTDFSEPVRYAYGTDSSPQPGVPRGTIFDHVWSTSRVFPGTNRRYWVNLIHRGEMPVTIGVFIDPGIFSAELPAKLGWDPKPENP